ncbi:MAG: PD-(D/E)XK nuclease family transposase [Acetivibrio ethanolgignens]
MIPGERLQEKQCILDIRLRINHREQIGIEMQVSRIADWPERSLYYLCRSFTSLNRGDYYETAISQTKKKLEKGKTATVIAEELETEISLIEQITKIISGLPVYTVEGVYEKLKNNIA